MRSIAETAPISFVFAQRSNSEETTEYVNNEASSDDSASKEREKSLDEELQEIEEEE